MYAAAAYSRIVRNTEAPTRARSSIKRAQTREHTPGWPVILESFRHNARHATIEATIRARQHSDVAEQKSSFANISNFPPLPLSSSLSLSLSPSLPLSLLFLSIDVGDQRTRTDHVKRNASTAGENFRKLWHSVRFISRLFTAARFCKSGICPGRVFQNKMAIVGRVA